jgi:hypothetical protein
MEKVKVYICHDSKDKTEIDKLSEFLQKEGISIIPTIKEYDTKRIKEIFAEVDFVLFACSQRNREITQLIFEYCEAKYQELKRHKSFIAVVKMEPCNIPFILEDKTIYNFTSGRQKLISDLKLELSRDHLHILTNDYQNGNLTLFCGAGVSKDVGLPLWKELIQLLLQEKEKDKKPSLINSAINSYNEIIWANCISHLSKDNFIEKVRKSLYFKTERNEKSPFIDTIINLCKENSKGEYPIKSIVTFNFDDLIEQNLGIHHIPYKSVFGLSKNENETGDNRILIYHPHGFLPERGKLNEEKNHIIFGETGYHEQYINMYNWNNLVQLNLLQNSTCLFIGTSLTDPNIRRLLDISYQVKTQLGKTGKHYIIKSKEDYYDSSDENCDEKAELITKYDGIGLEKLGLELILLEKRTAIPEYLKKIKTFQYGQ